MPPEGGSAIRYRALAVLLLAVLAPYAGAQDSFDAALAQARLTLDTDRLDEATALFERIAASYPARLAEIAADRAWAYVRKGNDALFAEDFEQADSLFALAVAIQPAYKEIVADPWAYCRLVQVEADLSAAAQNPRHVDWKAIERDLQWILTLKPGDADAHFFLGNAYGIQGKSDKAKREFAAALGGKPVRQNQSLAVLRDKVARGLIGRKYFFNLRPLYPPRLQIDPGPFQTYRDGVFLLYHHNAEVGQRVGAALNYYLSLPVLNGVLAADDLFPKECQVHIFADAEQFQASGGKQAWAGGQSRLQILDGEIVSAAMHLIQTTPELTESSVPHELVHVRLAASPFFFEGIPLWVQEGMAMSAESNYKKGSMARVIARTYEEGKLISVVELFAMTQYPEGTMSDIFYAESLAVVESLVSRYGRNPFRTFLGRLRTKDTAQAIKDVYGLSSAQAEDMVLGWAAPRSQRPR